MIRNPYSLIVLALLLCTSTVVAQNHPQEPMLRGRVISGEKPPQQNWGDVRIKVINRANYEEIEGEQKVTFDQTWYHVAVLGAHVDIMFDKACHIPAVLFNKYVKPGDNYLTNVKLRKTKPCLRLERQNSRHHALRLEFPTADVAAVRSHHFAVQPFEISEFTNAEMYANSDSVPSADTLKKELTKEAALARRGKFFDTFQYNFRVNWIVYSDVPVLRSLLLEFQEAKENQDLFSQLGNVPPEAFDDVIAAQFEISDQPHFENIKRVITDSTMSPSVRGSASIAFLNIKPGLPEPTVNQMIEYYRQQAQDSSSEIFATSLVVLARVGNNSDRAKLYDDALVSSDRKRVFASMNALRLAHIIEGPDAVPEGAKTLAEVANTSKDSTVRAAAFSALRPFAYTNDQTAITALVTGAQEDPDAAARFRATVALGVGELEDDPWVSKVLRQVAKADPSSAVRRAARFSLSGARWFPRLIRRKTISTRRILN
jgi:HEAT repeats